MTTNQSKRTKIGIKAIEAMQPHSIIWDATVPGFNARRQISNVVTLSSRLPDIGRHPAMAAPWAAMAYGCRIKRDRKRNECCALVTSAKTQREQGWRCGPE